MEDDNNSNANSNSSMIQWSSETNWIVAHGSLESSINIESAESETEDRTPNPPLVLKPHGPDSPPCEIKICFTKKYEIGQIYVRSSSRTFEVYYAKSPQSEDEYLCTVRCGVAERDEEILQTSFIEDVAKDQTEDVSTDGGSIVSSDDDWVRIKVPEVDRSSLSEKATIDKATKTQDLYEATAQISDADPCSLLTIRMLSLQDKGHVYVDEIYIYVDLVELTDTGPEVPGGSLSQSPLLAMLMPTLLQLSKPGASRVHGKQDSDEHHKQDSDEHHKQDSDEHHKGYKMESQLNRVDEVGVGLGNNHVGVQYVSSRDASLSDEIQQSNSALNSKKPVEFIDVNNIPQERIARSLEQLINRVSRVEDICLRFEEKMLKPIENMEARLQQVEQQLGKLTKNFNNSYLAHGTRIPTPEFSCCESNSSSFYNEGNDYITSEIEKKDLSSYKRQESSQYADIGPTKIQESSQYADIGPTKMQESSQYADIRPARMQESSQYADIRPNCPSLVIKAPDFICSESSSNSNSFYNEGNDSIPSEIEKKDFPCNKLHEAIHYANIRPGLVIKAPEFSCSVDEEYNDDLKELKDDTPCIKPKQTLSVDDALAAALSGFLSTARISLSENAQPTSGLSIQEEEQTPHHEFAEPCQTKVQESPDAENCSRGSSNYNQIHAVIAPDFVEEIVEEERLVNVTEQNPHHEFADSCETKAQEVPDTENCSRGSSKYTQILSVIAPDFVEEIGEDEVFVKDTEPPETDCVSNNEDKDNAPIETDCASTIHTSCVSNSEEEHVKDTEPSSDTNSFLKNEEKNQGNETRPPNVQSKILSSSEESSPNVSESLDFDFPILEVKFNTNMSSNIKSPLEALLDEETKSSNNEAPVPDVEDCNEITDLLPNHLLMDLGFSPLDGSVDLCTPSSQEMTSSLI